MKLQQTGTRVMVHTPAKLNLFFEVEGRRTDGFHDVATVVYPIDLYDTIVFESTDDGCIAFHLDDCIRGSANSEPSTVPTDASNLAVRAVRQLQQQFGESRGARLHLTKRIPSQAGLGGGSSDAAAALVAAVRGWKLCCPRNLLNECAAELGSDVPLFLTPGATLCQGRGERVEPLDVPGDLHFVVAMPPEGLSTAAVYAGSQPPPPPRRRDADHLRDALAKRDVRRIAPLLFNRLETAAESLSPWIRRLRDALLRADCLASRMSGSGTSCFGLCRSRRHALRVANTLAARLPVAAYAVSGSR